jgi:hypothetical protein
LVDRLAVAVVIKEVGVKRTYCVESCYFYWSVLLGFFVNHVLNVNYSV